MRVVAAVHALRLSGTEKCPFDFATDLDSAESENKARMDRAVFFSATDAVDSRNGLTRVVRPGADRLVGPVVELAEQNTIDLVPAAVASSHICEEAFRDIAAEGQTEAPQVPMSDLSYWRAGSGRLLGGAMAHALEKSRKGRGVR